MKIQFLGTGSISSISNPSSYLIDDKLLIDCGNGITKVLLNNSNPYDINTLLVTHLHGDHIADIPFLILIRSFINIQNKLTIYGPKNIEEVVKEMGLIYFNEGKNVWDEFFKKANVEFIEIENGEYKIDDYVIKVIDVEHGDFKPAYGFIINNKIGFSGDSSLCANIEKMLEEVDYAILDTSFLKGVSSHMGLDTFKELSTKYLDTILIPTHMNDEVKEEIKSLNNKNIQVYDDLDILVL